MREAPPIAFTVTPEPSPATARDPAGTLLRRVIALAFVASAIAGCAGPVAVGKHAYEDSRYLEAAEWFGQHEPDLSRLSAHDQADYAIYRGLALLHLGDRAAAQRWLAFAHDLERAGPGTLDASQRSALDQGWSALGQSDSASASPRPAPSHADDGPHPREHEGGT